jgi:oligosaccharide repeat unit polymerase
MEVVALAFVYILLIAFVFFKQDLISPGVVFSISLLAPALLFKVDLNLQASLVFACSALLFFFGSLLGSIINPRRSGVSKSISPSFVYFLFIVGFVAFLINVIRVFLELGFLAYVTADSKAIELTFGRHTTINYLFFLLMIVPSLCLLSTIPRFIKFPLILTCLVCLTFSGIKSTFIFGLSITLFTYLQVFGLHLRFLILVVPGVLFLITAMFAFVNMAGDFALEKYFMLLYGYIGINYKNFELELAVRDSFTYGKYTFFFLTKLLDSKYSGGYYASSDFNLLNVDYNMGTVLREFFVDFNLLGMFLILLLLGVVSGFVYKLARIYGGAVCVVSSILLTACLFAFFGNQFIRLQFLWLLSLVIVIGILSRYKYVWH